MSLFINDSCVGCTFCHNQCPVNAISYNGDRYQIDEEKCISCGTCSRVCLMDAIEDTDQPPAPVPAHPPLFKTCDFAVVGGGAAGLVAAARFAEQTGKKVIVLEKHSKVGGSGYFAVGLTPENTRWQREAGVPDHVEEQVSAAMERTQGKLDPALLHNLFASSGAFFDWLETWAPVEKCFGLNPHPFTGALSVGANDPSYGSGRFITTEIQPYLKRLGVEVLTNTAATGLKLDEAGKVSAVLARDPGGEVEIRCTQCLLSTGSLIGSQRIRDLVPEFAQAKPKRYAHNMPMFTGDGLTLAENAGIPVNTDGIVMAFVGCMPVAFEEGIFKQAERSDFIRVNLQGQRFVSEQEPGFVMGEALLHQPQAISYTVMDSSVLASPAAKAPAPSDRPPMPEEAYPGGVPDFAVTRGTKTPNTPEAFQAYSEKLGHQVLLWGNTWKELGEKAGIDPAGLEAQVARYNALCAAGEDSDFGKHPNLLRPLVKPPFFAVRNYLYLDGVFGGLNVTPNVEVVGENGPVPGLYAAGDIACGRYVNDRLHKTEVINDYTWAITGGFMAANRAIEQAGRE